MASQPNGQLTRSLATQTALMEAAEKLVAKNGIHRVSIKQIVAEAGQKNESALQYHFKNLHGLINAIHSRRHKQTQDKRTQLLESLLETKKKPELRDLCEIMVSPTFELAKADPRFRRYIAAFSHEVVLADDSALTMVNKAGGGGESGMQTGELLRKTLAHLDEITFRNRMELAVRMCSAAMRSHARHKNAFKGREAELFISNLVDGLEGLLSAPVSKKTKLLSK